MTLLSAPLLISRATVWPVPGTASPVGTFYFNNALTRTAALFDLAPAGTAVATADAVAAEPNATADADPIDEQRGRAALGGHRTVDDFVVS